MLKFCISYVAISIIFISEISQASENKVNIVDSAQVQGGKIIETWTLAWIGNTQQVCGLESEVYESCLCEGFRFGQTGNLMLYRSINGKTIDSLKMPPHEDYENESQYSQYDQKLYISDSSHLKSLQKRSILQLRDYVNDGHSKIFPYLIGSGAPCGHSKWVLIGTTKKNQKLHILNNQNSNVIFDGKDAVISLATRDTFVQNTIPCGDHAAEFNTKTVYIKYKGNISSESYNISCLDINKNIPTGFSDSLKRKVIEGTLQTNKSYVFANCVADELSIRYSDATFMKLFKNEKRINSAFTKAIKACHENNNELSKEWLHSEIK